MTLATAPADQLFTRTLLTMLRTHPYVSLLRGNYPEGYLTLSPDGQYVRVNHYGQYAVRATHTGVKGLFDNVLDDITAVTPAHYSEYHVNVIPDDPTYIAVDHSYMHPNVYGK